MKVLLITKLMYKKKVAGTNITGSSEIAFALCK